MGTYNHILTNIENQVSKFEKERRIKFVTESDFWQLDMLHPRMGRIYEDKTRDQRRINAEKIENEEKDALDANLVVIKNILNKIELDEKELKRVQDLVVKSMRYAAVVGYQATASDYLKNI